MNSIPDAATTVPMILDADDEITIELSLGLLLDPAYDHPAFDPSHSIGQDAG